MKSRRVLTLLVAVVIGAALAGPGVAYVLAMQNVDGLPSPAGVAATDAKLAAAAWRACGESGPIAIAPDNPWNFSYRLLTATRVPRPGDRAVWAVARRHNVTHPLADHRYWHFSGAALQIWITRNWSAEQVAATLARDNLCHDV